MSPMVAGVVVVAVAAGMIVAVPPSAWREAEHMARWHLCTLEEAIRPAAVRTAEWLEGRTDGIGDPLVDRGGDAEPSSVQQSSSRETPSTCVEE